MSVGSCKFAAAEGDSGKIPFSMLARSAEPVINWYFGPIYHDFAGMKHRDSIATDYCHYDTEILGFCDQFTVDEIGLHLAGAIVPFAEGDRASEVAHKQKAGVPYEASIDFTGDDIVIEEVREGYTAEVNGRHVQGPCAIIREWSLRGVAICPHGMDSRTETQFSQRDKKTVVQLFSQSNSKMAKTSITGKKPAAKLSNKAPKPAPATKMAEDDEEEEKPDTEQDDEAEDDKPAEDSSEDEKDPDTEQDDEADDDEKEKPEQKQSAGKSKFGKELAKFTKQFGVENGTKWFLDGKTIDQAMSLHNKNLERQLAAKDAELEKLNKRLKQAKTGEEVSSTFSEDTKDAPAAEGNAGDASKFAHMGANMSKFAASLKLPTRK